LNVSTAREPVMNSSPTGPAISITRLQTRFLCPFNFDRDRLETAADVCCNDRFARADDANVWLRAKPHHLYTDEFLDHLVIHLFGSSISKKKASIAARLRDCEYLQAGILTQKWFKDATVEFTKGKPIAIQLASGMGIELFLSSHGVGVLSVALTVDAPALTGDEAREFNYRLSQFRRSPLPLIRKAHASDDPERWSRIPDGDKAKVPPRPADEAPIEDRLSQAGGRFSMQELMARLLRPLMEDFHLDPIEPRELSVYTVARLSECDFSDADVREQLGPMLAGLAQIEEKGHVGNGPSELGVPDAVLNRRHWAAVGILGAAHLIADQTTASGDPAPFNDMRAQIVRDKYFISYLVAMLQRLTVNRAVREAGEIFALKPDQRPEATGRLRQNLLRFGVGGQFNQISSRQAHHRYYQLCRSGLDVLPAWTDLRGIIGELDSDQIAHQQTASQQRLESVAAQLNRSVFEIETIQSVVHLIEYLLAAAYSAHLWYMLVEKHELHRWLVTGTTLAAALIGVGFVYLLNKIGRGKKQSHDRPHAAPPMTPPPSDN
jgi:hypothetical protein